MENTEKEGTDWRTWGTQAGVEVGASTTEEFQKLWTGLDNLPTPAPSGKMRDNFYAMLHQEMEKQEVKKNRFAVGAITSWFSSPYAWAKLTFGIVVIGVAMMMGWFAGQRSEMVQLVAEVQNMKEAMLLTLLQQPSATQRLKAVSLSYELDRENQPVIEALLITLNEDPNINVRLAAVDALGRLGHLPIVREGLIRSLANQDSPLVQLALADMLTSFKDVRVVPELEKLLSAPSTNKGIKKHLEESIEKIKS